MTTRTHRVVDKAGWFPGESGRWYVTHQVSEAGRQTPVVLRTHEHQGVHTWVS